MKFKMKYLLLAAASLMAMSCSVKRYTYLQDMEEGQKYAIEQYSQALVHVNDRLNIVVTCKNPELALPFNSQTGLIDITNNQITAVGQNLNQGYRVDSDGYINFPILGRILVEGLTIKQTSDLIKALRINGDYIKDPTVTIDFLNFKYITWGAIGNGVHTVASDHVTIIEALASAGGVPKTSRLDNVMVLREINGNREIYKMDLRSKDLFNSPGYYLQQNDIVYVEPKDRLDQRIRQNIGSVVGVMSTITGFVLLMWNLGYRSR